MGYWVTLKKTVITYDNQSDDELKRPTKRQILKLKKEGFLVGQSACLKCGESHLAAIPKECSPTKIQCNHCGHQGSIFMEE